MKEGKDLNQEIIKFITMKRLLFALLLFSSPVLAEKYTIYTTERPPSSWSGIIDSEGYFYWFTNAYPPALKHNLSLIHI